MGVEEENGRTTFKIPGLILSDFIHFFVKNIFSKGREKSWERRGSNFVWNLSKNYEELKIWVWKFSNESLDQDKNLRNSESKFRASEPRPKFTGFYIKIVY